MLLGAQHFENLATIKYNFKEKRTCEVFCKDARTLDIIEVGIPYRCIELGYKLVNKTVVITTFTKEGNVSHVEG